MEELGKALTNRCRAVRMLNEKRRKTQRGTIDRHTYSEQLEFECQLKTPTRSRIHELLNLGASSSHNLFQSLITNQDLLRLREDMWPNHRPQRKGWWCRAFPAYTCIYTRVWVYICTRVGAFCLFVLSNLSTICTCITGVCLTPACVCRRGLEVEVFHG